MTLSAISSPPSSIFKSYHSKPRFFTFSLQISPFCMQIISQIFSQFFEKKLGKISRKKNSKIITVGGIRTSLPTNHYPLPPAFTLPPRRRSTYTAKLQAI